MSRRLLVNRNVNPAEGVNPSVQPNIGQYGWTSYDAAHINQLIAYVDVAREYSERTQLHADYVRDAMRDFIEPTLREIRVVYTQLVAANNGWTLKYEKFQEDYADFLNKYNVFQRDLGEFKTDLADINVKYTDIQQRHLDIRTKHTEVAENTKKVEDIYSEMKDGQVYRGIWNPEGATAYPDPENTNSSWDVVLRDDLDSVVFDNKTWQTGNRLIWIKTDNAYTQIKTTTQVTSVNGKSGAVILTHSDVGAISTSGGTATGAIESPEFKAPLFGQSAQHTMFKSKNAHLKVTDGKIEYGVYSEANKPSAADVGALPITGGSISGVVKFSKNNGTYLSDNLSSDVLGRHADKGVYIHNGGNYAIYSGTSLVQPSVLRGSNTYNIYHQGFKPTASDVGALATTGGNLSGHLNVNAKDPWDGVGVTHTDGGSVSLRFLNDIATIRYGGNGASSSNGFQVASVGDAVRFKVDNAGELYAAGTKRVYHQGFKPTTADIGAIASTNGSFSGSLTVTNYGKLGSMGPTALGLSANYAAVLSSNDTNGVVLAANSEFNGSWVKRVPGKTASMLIHPTNGITEIRYAPADSDTFAVHKVYSSLNKPTASDVGALALTGGTVSSIIDNTTNIGKSGCTYEKITSWAHVVGSSKFVHPSSTGNPNEKGGYWQTIGRRDAAGGYAGIWVDFANDKHDVYIGKNETGTNTPIWAKVYTDKNKPTAADVGIIKQTSAVDTTAGAVLSVGSFGVGTAGFGFSANLSEDRRYSHFSASTSAATDLPGNNTQDWGYSPMIHAFRAGGDGSGQVGQIIFGIDRSNKGRMASRVRNTNTWSSWKIFHDNESLPYETGTFTPIVAGSSTAGAGNYGLALGKYTRIGNRCFFDIALSYNGHTGAGNFVIKGLPFVTAANSGYTSLPVTHRNLTTTAGLVSAIIGTSSTAFTLYGINNGNEWAPVSMDASADIRFSGHYEI